MERLTGRVIKAGNAEGMILFSAEPLSFFGHVDPQTGIITESGHPLEGQSVAGRILVFPHAKGSTVGSYVLYALRCNGAAPAALVLQECEAIVAVGAIIAGIPTVDSVDITKLQAATRAIIDNEVIDFE